MFLNLWAMRKIIIENIQYKSSALFIYGDLNPLSPSIKLQILPFCLHAFLTDVVGEAVNISTEFDLSDHVLNSHYLPN